MERKRALIAMSGGVDSSVAAYLTLSAGYECAGATMRLYDNKDFSQSAFSDVCGSPEYIEDARNIAYRLNIPYHIFDFTGDFAKCVIDSFVQSYELGLTPNPCIYCNRHLKFDRLLRQAQELNYDYIVTGHYGQIQFSQETGRYHLCKSLDKTKDQTYFLYSLTQHQLAHTLFPLGGITKAEVREIARQQNFLNAKKRDSQDICFVPDGDYFTFMKKYTGKSYAPGDFLNKDGKVVGQHKGAVGYTIGQRKGLGIALGEPVYVCSKDMQRNTVTVDTNEALFHSQLLATDWNWFPFPELTEPMRVTAKARSRQQEQPAWVYPEEGGQARVVFDEPQRAITPGQAVVLYDGDMVVGGGTIAKAL